MRALLCVCHELRSHGRDKSKKSKGDLRKNSVIFCGTIVTFYGRGRYEIIKKLQKTFTPIDFEQNRSQVLSQTPPASIQYSVLKITPTLDGSVRGQRWHFVARNSGQISRPPGDKAEERQTDETIREAKLSARTNGMLMALSLIAFPSTSGCLRLRTR